MKQKLDKSRYLAYNKHIRLYSDLKYYEKDVSQMKNTLKKIAATAMAFAILGAGTTFWNNTTDKNTSYVITASAVDVSVHGPIIRSYLTSSKSGKWMNFYRRYVHKDGYHWDKFLYTVRYE